MSVYKFSKKNISLVLILSFFAPNFIQLVHAQDTGAYFEKEMFIEDVFVGDKFSDEIFVRDNFDKLNFVEDIFVDYIYEEEVFLEQKTIEIENLYNIPIEYSLEFGYLSEEETENIDWKSLGFDMALEGGIVLASVTMGIFTGGAAIPIILSVGKSLLPEFVGAVGGTIANVILNYIETGDVTLKSALTGAIVGANVLGFADLGISFAKKGVKKITRKATVEFFDGVPIKRCTLPLDKEDIPYLNKYKEGYENIETGRWVKSNDPQSEWNILIGNEAEMGTDLLLKKDGWTILHKNRVGSFYKRGHGLDHVAKKGNFYFIIDSKAEGATLAPGQMNKDYILGYRLDEAVPEEAANIRKAYSEGRVLVGKMHHTLEGMSKDNLTAQLYYLDEAGEEIKDRVEHWQMPID